MANRFFPSYEDYKITSPYGMRTLQGVTKMHNGIDLVAKMPSGASAIDYITAHSAGTVIDTGFDASAGNYVWIQVSDNVKMCYFHMLDNSITVKVGEKVAKGQRIGYMGSTGHSTAAHLHFGIKVNNKYIDPTPYLDSDYKETNTTENGVVTVTIEMQVLKKGSKGEQVKTLQRLLNAFGNNLAVDGSFGPATLSAVKIYQSNNNLAVDGSVGKATWTSLLH